MKVNIVVSDSDPIKGKYTRVDIVDLSANISLDTIPAVLALVSATLHDHLTTKLHAASLGVSPEKEEPSI